ncbi:VOC family protein [Enterococcus sp. CSURQ0835]|uniref:VOC family protein n=1 Tax=Enterococcus sp. CSURQ0835 TaxID=2681394 RepID=UPI001359DAD9|nr:VOC family protein [Enterococcus sp. CSURQ0835]
MINHFDLKVTDLAVSSHFYQQILRPLNYQPKIYTEKLVSFGDGLSTDPMGDLYLSGGIPTPFHFAFQAPSRAAVDQFYAAGLQFGGRSNGAPGLRDYHPDYYAAFLIDPDGYRIEAVCHT